LRAASGNNAAIPVSPFSPKSYIVWSGVQTPWCSGGTATTRSAFLNVGFAIVYYFIRSARATADLQLADHPLLVADFSTSAGRITCTTALPDWADPA
jgi:cytochrome c oxidase cbb3-type subunit 1